MRKRGGVPAVPPTSGGRSSKPASKPYDFGFTALASSSARKPASVAASPLGNQPAAAAASPQKAVATISDLEELASSRIDAIKRSFDHSHAEIVKEFEASNARLSKRLKLQTQACLQLSEEVEKDYSKMSGGITGNMELMKASYAELIVEAQASASRVCKVTIPELAQSLEKAIYGLRSRYKLPLPSA